MEQIKHIELSTFVYNGLTYTISRPEQIVCTDGRTEPMPIINWQAVDADGKFAGNQSIQLSPEIPTVDPPQWGPLPNPTDEPAPAVYAEPKVDLAEYVIADSRAFFNAVEALRLEGAGRTANALDELGRDPIIKARLWQLADEGGYSGGLRAAESAAEDVHDAIQSELRRMG